MQMSFAPDLYAGTAEYYARYRVPYPQAMLEELLDRLEQTPDRGLDLACGTGQVALALAPYVRELLAIDQEPEMIEVARAAADRAGVDNVRWQVGRGEELIAPVDAFDLITIGNAFHRLDRSLIAERARDWLAPGGALALLQSDTFWTGAEPWQRLVVDIVAKWTEGRPSYSFAAGPRRTHEDVLREAGYDVEKHEFSVPHTWRLDEIVGFLYSTSVASRSALGDRVEAFEADLRQALLNHDSSGKYAETMQFAFILAR